MVERRARRAGSPGIVAERSCIRRCPLSDGWTGRGIRVHYLPNPMDVTVGSRIGPYEVRALVGEGGMGRVFRAVDTMLQREVAIKVLPASLQDDPDRLMRFEREAKTLAALNHPHIAQIHGLEQGNDGTRALVMELVEGEDLAERLTRGPIPLDEALPIARQIADALEAAYDAGIVHRDLKPANIKVRPDGTVKVLDYGLAKQDGAGGDEMLDSPTTPHRQ